VRDLAQWADGRYRVAAEGAADTDTDNPDISSLHSADVEP
jgi:endogenous inhibitor of DNA gyrase (YacG/DUF329 family)